ncbi:MAG: hypothetical protein C5B59_02430 [Bacteroidetes bacterium]|nr:MAG: hypothetical protein C5B59_02430 [Bacteroidota bacterium]
MKRIITCAVLLLAVFSFKPVVAQQQDPQARMAAMRQKMKDDLKLTDVQADSVSNIQREFMPKRREVFADQTLSEADKKTKLQSINEEANKRIQAVLGDDLFRKYQDWWEKNRPQRGGQKSQ